MKETNFTKAVDYVVALEKKAIDQFVVNEFEPLAKFGNPESLIGKPYELWTPEDKMLLAQIYGPEPNALSHLIFKKAKERIEKLENEVAGG